jgi:hypothetical protein
LLKDIITIFYSPLAQVYRAASIADSLSDLQNFINDLIRTVEQVEESRYQFDNGQHTLLIQSLAVIQDNPHHTVQAFIDLIQRHEQSFYYFVHKVHSKGEGLFNSLMQWVEMFLTVVREGLGDPLSLEFLLPHTGQERTDILSEVDKVAMYHYKLKLVYEGKLRRRFGNAQGQNDADADDEATQTLVNGVLGEIDFGALAGSDALDIAAEETDVDSDDDGYSSSNYANEETSSQSGSSDSTEDSNGSSNSAHSPKADQPRMSHYVKAASAAPTPTGKTHHVQSHLGNLAAASSSSLASAPPLPRKRSISLMRMKSLTSLGSRKQSADSIPPVPSLPTMPQTAVPVVSMSSSSSKSSLPPSSRLPMRTMSSQSPPKSDKVVDKRKRRKENLIKSPELVHIPQLLPVFVELVSF